tara:strand:+ start:501 stop:740 length:240 start_codon:yes stop_codon:yes gene_type:complete
MKITKRQLRQIIRESIEEALSYYNTPTESTDELHEDDLEEIAPPGWEGTVKKMKKNPEIENPWALAWSMKKKGYKPNRK